MDRPQDPPPAAPQPAETPSELPSELKLSATGQVVAKYFLAEAIAALRRGVKPQKPPNLRPVMWQWIIREAQKSLKPERCVREAYRQRRLHGEAPEAK